MTRTEALPLARSVAAAVCELDGCHEEYCTFMREGRYDDEREVQVALSAVVLATKLAQRAPAKPVELVA